MSSSASTTFRTMLKCYLLLTLFLQFALINAAKIRRGSVLRTTDAQEHVHIKVYIPDISRTRARPPAVHRLQSNQQKSNLSHQRGGAGAGAIAASANNNKLLPTLPTHSGESKETAPYEFDFYGLGAAGGGGGDDDEENISSTSGRKYGPVVFTSNIQSGNTQQPMSQQFMRQLFSPEVMSVLKTDNDENVAANPYGLMEEPTAAFDANEIMNEYFQKLNQPKTQRSTAATTIQNNYSPKIVHKRKKYGNFGIGEGYPQISLQEQFYNTILKERNTPTTKTRKNAKPHHQWERKRKHQQRQEFLSPQPPPPLYDNFKAFQQNLDDDTSMSSVNSDELETSDDISLSSSASTSASMEDMATAFNGLKPISYYDMYGEYATPITTETTLLSSVASSSASTSNHNQQKHYQPQHQQHRHQQKQQPSGGLGLHQETIPTYTSTVTSPNTANNWLQSYQRLEKQQQQTYYKPHHQQQHQLEQQLQQQQQHSPKKHKQPKSQQTQFVLQPKALRLASSPTLSLTTSPLSSSVSSLSSPSSSLSSTSSLSTPPISSGFGGSSNSLGSSFSTWSIPYDFVQQSHQQQLAAQQQPQQQDYKLTSYKKRKNRTKRKSTRIPIH